MSNYNSIVEIFKILNQNNIDYLILRNFENLLDDRIYVGGHEDIDFLVADSKEVIKALGAISNRKYEDFTHYHIYVGGNRVNLDLRSVGDGYYCENWQKEMLQNKKQKECFYIMSDEDYFYSLIYHAIIQKKKFSEEYQQRLTLMGKALGLRIETNTQECFILCLEEFMVHKEYKYSYTEDPSIPLRFNLVKKKLIQKDFRRQFRRIIFFIQTICRTVITKVINLFF